MRCVGTGRAPLRDRWHGRQASFRDRCKTKQTRFPASGPLPVPPPNPPQRHFEPSRQRRIRREPTNLNPAPHELLLAAAALIPVTSTEAPTNLTADTTRNSPCTAPSSSADTPVTSSNTNRAPRSTTAPKSLSRKHFHARPIERAHQRREQQPFSQRQDQHQSVQELARFAAESSTSPSPITTTSARSASFASSSSRVRSAIRASSSSRARHNSSSTRFRSVVSRMTLMSTVSPSSALFELTSTGNTLPSLRLCTVSKSNPSRIAAAICAATSGRVPSARRSPMRSPTSSSWTYPYAAEAARFASTIRPPSPMNRMMSRACSRSAS